VTAPSKKFSFLNLSSPKVTVSVSSVAVVELIPPFTLLNVYVPALVGRTLHDSVEVVSNKVSTFVLSVLNETLAYRNTSSYGVVPDLVTLFYSRFKVYYPKVNVVRSKNIIILFILSLISLIFLSL